MTCRDGITILHNISIFPISFSILLISLCLPPLCISQWPHTLVSGGGWGTLYNIVSAHISHRYLSLCFDWTYLSSVNSSLSLFLFLSLSLLLTHTHTFFRCYYVLLLSSFFHFFTVVRYISISQLLFHSCSPPFSLLLYFVFSLFATYEKKKETEKVRER